MLTASNLTTGLLGFIFSMYLSKVLGPEGMGLYGIIMPIYNLYSSRDDYKNIIRTMKVVAIFNFIWCLIIGIFVFFLSPIIGHFWAKDPRIIKSIMVTCPAMIFIALSNILKGFFYGTSKITVPSFIDILEKTHLIFSIEAYGTSSKRMKKTKKYYFALEYLCDCKYNMVYKKL